MERFKTLDEAVKYELRSDPRMKSGKSFNKLEEAIEWTRREMRSAAQGVRSKKVNSKRHKMLDVQA